MTEALCPRCGGPLGDHAARSRMHTARSTAICGLCGTDEAVRDARGLSPIAPEDWPIRRS